MTLPGAKPVGDGRQRVAPTKSVELPAPHGVHVAALVAPADAEKVLTGQGVHASAPETDEKVPAGQIAHAPAPACSRALLSLSGPVRTVAVDLAAALVLNVPVGDASNLVAL